MFTVHDYLGADGQALRYGRLSDAAQPSGNGRALWFVPGLGGSVKGALEFLEALQSEFDVIYGSDLRSFGLNLLETPLTSADMLLKDLEAFYQNVIRPAGHSEVFLCGISLGGVLATLMAAQNGDRFQRLILLAPAYKPHRQSFGLRYTLVNTLSYLIQGKNARTTLPYGIKELTRNETVLNDPQYTDQNPLVLSPGFLLSVRSLCNRAMAKIPDIHTPTLMVIPGQDVVCDPDAMRQAFERIPENTSKALKEYPDFYHDVLFETGHTEIAQEIRLWLSDAIPCASLSSSRSSR